MILGPHAEHPNEEFRTQGKVSWFEEEGNKTATGIPTSSGGIAVCSNHSSVCHGSPAYNLNSLGGWWLVLFPNGKVLVLQQIDIGPAPFTNRVIDVAGGSLSAAGYSKSNFPTDSEVKAVYLGKVKPKAAGSTLAEEIFGKEIIPGEKHGFGTGIILENPVEAITKPIKSVKDLVEKTGEVLGFLGSAEGWFRIGKVVVGSALLLIAVAELAKVGSGSEGSSIATKGGSAVYGAGKAKYDLGKELGVT
jgi:hypothetical protein